MNERDHATGGVSRPNSDVPVPLSDDVPVAGPEPAVVVAQPVFEPLFKPRPLTVEDLRSPRRRIVLPIILFLVTCLSTFWAGATHWMPANYFVPGDVAVIRHAINQGWQQGLVYMAALLGILLTHEMGHFVATLRYRIPASLPYFIPFPIAPIGTMGAVIGMEGYKANRRQMFDIGIAGPIAGLVVAIPVLWIGIRRLDLSGAGFGGMAFDCPLLVHLLIGYLRPEIGNVNEISLSQLNPLFMAGWVGLLITGLNMLPVSQLDGGHVIYALFRRRAHWIARGFLLSAITFVVFEEAYIWTVMVVLVTLIGTDHPPTSDDRVSLGWFRALLGYASLLIPVFCFPLRGVIQTH